MRGPEPSLVRVPVPPENGHPAEGRVGLTPLPTIRTI